MLKEINLRVYIKKLGKIVNVEEINFSNKTIGVNVSGEGYLLVYSFKDVELIQYTGLKDKNGKEIFESDIMTDSKINYVVAFYAGAWRLKSNITSDAWWKSLYRYVNDCKVIGNIYENPELLKEAK